MTVCTLASIAANFDSLSGNRGQSRAYTSHVTGKELRLTFRAHSVWHCPIWPVDETCEPGEIAALVRMIETGEKIQQACDRICG